MKFPVTLFGLLLTFPSFVSAQQIYKWKDERGQWHFGNASSEVGNKAQVSVTVTPAQAAVRVNQTQRFTATVSGTTDQQVTWSVIPGGNGNFGLGTIDATGLYTAPRNAPEPPFVTIKATSVADPSAAGTASVIVRGIRNYPQRNADNDLDAFNWRTYISFGWDQLPLGTAKIVLFRASSSNGPWTQVGTIENPSGLSPVRSFTDGWLVTPDSVNDYYYKMEAFSATGMLLKSYAPVFVPKFVGP